MNVLPVEKQVRVIAALIDGVSIRATSRMTEVHQDTIGRLGLTVGEGCILLHDRIMRDLHVSVLQLDEQWSYVHTKQKHLHEKSSSEHGDAWTFIALDATHRTVISYLVGKRTKENARDFVSDVRMRVLGRPHISCDGFEPYVNAVEEAFGSEVDFGVLQKQYGAKDGASENVVRYKGAVRKAVTGNPINKLISTSYIERSNLTVRMSQRRFTRKCNGFSKKLRNHKAAVALHFAHYNLCRVHETLRVTPAMSLGVTDHIWTIEELIEAALSIEPEEEAAPEPMPPHPAPSGRPVLRVITGGRVP